MNGLELLKNVKTVRPNMMFIIMTAYLEIKMAGEAIRLGATDFIRMLDKGVNYLQKPFTVESLARKVREVLDK
jgi:DNA-binding NtrC family response regulator